MKKRLFIVLGLVQFVMFVYSSPSTGIRWGESYQVVVSGTRVLNKIKEIA